MILWFKVFTPTTIAAALTSPDILVILLAVCCIAVVGGVFIWFIDRYTPNSSFPPTYLHGVCTGIYWAIVSMTTVGYGDKVPKSRYVREGCCCCCCCLGACSVCIYMLICQQSCNMSRLAKAFTVLFLMIGIMMISLLQVRCVGGGVVGVGGSALFNCPIVELGD